VADKNAVWYNICDSISHTLICWFKIAVENKRADYRHTLQKSEGQTWYWITLPPYTIGRGEIQHIIIPPFKFVNRYLVGFS